MPGGTTRRVPVRTPPSTPSSLYFESRSPFTVSASIVDRRGLVPPLDVPVLTREDLARPGDSLFLGPIVSNDAERGHFGFTFPGVDRDAAPFRVRVRLTAPGGGALLHESTFVLTGLPLTVEDPWKRFSSRRRSSLRRRGHVPRRREGTAGFHGPLGVRHRQRPGHERAAIPRDPCRARVSRGLRRARPRSRARPRRPRAAGREGARRPPAWPVPCPAADRAAAPRRPRCSWTARG